jgi:hypothetical protein
VTEIRRSTRTTPESRTRALRFGIAAVVGLALFLFIDPRIPESRKLNLAGDETASSWTVYMVIGTAVTLFFGLAIVDTVRGWIGVALAGLVVGLLMTMV